MTTIYDLPIPGASPTGIDFGAFLLSHGSRCAPTVGYSPEASNGLLLICSLTMSITIKSKSWFHKKWIHNYKLCATSYIQFSYPCSFNTAYYSVWSQAWCVVLPGVCGHLPKTAISNRALHEAWRVKRWAVPIATIFNNKYTHAYLPIKGK